MNNLPYSCPLWTHVRFLSEDTYLDCPSKPHALLLLFSIFLSFSISWPFFFFFYELFALLSFNSLTGFPDESVLLLIKLICCILVIKFLYLKWCLFYLSFFFLILTITPFIYDISVWFFTFPCSGVILIIFSFISFSMFIEHLLKSQSVYCHISI